MNYLKKMNLRLPKFLLAVYAVAYAVTSTLLALLV